MRVALLGAGLSAGAHLKAIQAIGATVTSVATRSEERFGRVRELFPGARQLWPPRRALDDRPDLVLVLTPPDTHLELVTATAERGLDVLVEKPLEITAERARRLVEIAEAAGIGLAVCFQHRAKEAGRALHELTSDGSLGELVGGTLSVNWWRPQAYYDEAGRGTLARDGGGVLITQAIHGLDLLVWSVGAPRRVVALTGRSPVHTLEAEDSIAALLNYGGGAAVSLYATTAASPGTPERLTLVGGRATAVLDGPRLDVWEVGGRASRSWGAEGPSGIDADTNLMPAQWHTELLRDAVAAFDQGRQPLASGRSALDTQLVVEALYRAGGSPSWVDVAPAGIPGATLRARTAEPGPRGNSG
jgi:UDP-N-acetyl-2-amino-2-deoxyglucuronate dehydrogenase